MATTTDLYQRLGSVINDWQAFVDQQREWLATPDETLDTAETDKGKRILTDSTGNQVLVDSPAQLEWRVSQAIAEVQAALPTAEEALDKANQALTYTNTVEATLDAKVAAAATSESNANTYMNTALTAASDAETEANIATAQATQASTSAAAAAVSETNAAASELASEVSRQASDTSASNAATSEANALASKNAAKTSETNAAASESAAATSATASANSATASANSATASASSAASSESSRQASEASALEALASEDAAATSEANAATSEANSANSAVASETSRQASATAATNAATSEANAATSEANAATSEANAATSASESSASAAASSASAEASAASASDSADSATDSANSATASANSATASANSATASALSESNAAASESAASLSEANALASKNAAKTSETNALSSKNAAASSATAASQSATNAAASETNAAASEFASSISEANSVASAAASESSSQASAASASDSADSAAASLSSANTANDHRLAAATSETNAAASEASALASKNAAKTSETNAAASEASALASKNAAKTSEANAASSASSALSSKNAASTSETNAASSASDAADSATASANSATASANSATASANSASAANAHRVAAATSDTNAAASAAAAQDSEDSAAADAASALSSKNAAASSATSASNSAAAAATSETNAAASESAAAASEANALSSKNSAASSASTATTKASQASASASAAATSETNAANSAAAAAADADRAAAAADSVTNALVPRGDWDASGGVFPTPTMSPERSDFYHITVAGTMVNASNPAQDDISVEVGDQLYWHVDKDVWYKIDNTDRINTVNGQIGDVVLDYSDVGALGASQNAVSASKWQTPRTLSLTGDVYGSATMDGSGNTSLSVTIYDDSHSHHRISVEDTRDRSITPNDLNDKAVSVQFTNLDKPSGLGSWYSALSVKGWSDGYQTWQILGGSSTVEDNELYFRRGHSDSWTSTQRIFMDDYHPNADKLTTARTLTVGNSAKSFDGSANVSWSLSEMGAVNKAGDTMSGNLTTPNVYITSGTLHINHDGTTSDTLITMDGSLEVDGKTYINNAAGDNIVEFTKKANSNYGSRFFGTIYENYDRVFSEAYHPNADKWTTARTLTLTGDVTGSVSWDGSGDASITTNISTINNSVTIDGGNSTQLTVYSDDAGEAEIRAMGDGQGTGRLFVGQSASYGGGIEYNGDGTPASTGAPSDSITLFRVAGAGKEWTAYNPYSSNHWYFRGLIHVDGDQRVFADNYHPNADKWTSARTLTLSGDASGSVSIDGSSNVSLNVTIADDSHNHVISNVDGLQSKLDSKVDLSGDKLTGRLFGAAMVPNMINNSYMNLLDGSKPAGWYSTGVTIEAVSPYTKAFEGPYWSQSAFDARTIGVDVTDDPELATESMPYWFGVYDKGNRIQRGGLRDGWHSTNDGNILKVSGTGLLGQHCHFYPTYDSNQLGTRWMFSAWVKCVKGKGFSVGVDAGYFDRQANFTSKATIDAGPEGWLRISKIINTSQVTSIDKLALSMAFNADDNGDIEGYIALPYVANIDYTGTNEDSWAPSLSDTLSRKGLTVLPDINGNGGVGVHNENPAYPLDVLGDLNATAIREDGVLLTDKYLLNNGTWTGGTGSSYTTLAGSINSDGNAKFTFHGTDGKMDVITDGEFYANEGADKVYHSGNKPTASDVGALPSTGGVMTGTLNLADQTLLFYGDGKINRGQNPGDGLIPGSNNSLNLFAPTNGHVTVALPSNDSNDSFNVVSSEGTATSGHTYTRRAFWVQGQGHTYAAGNMYVNNDQRVFAENFHPNADKWTTARTLTVAGDVAGSVSIDGSGDVTLYTTIADDSHNHIIANVDGLQSALDSKFDLNSTHGTPAAAYHRNNYTSDVGTKIRLPFNTNSAKMVTFTIRVYQGYWHADVQVSGYLYFTEDHWYAPKATMISGTRQMTVKFGRDTDGRAYVWIEGSNYRGIGIFNAVAGNGGANFNEGWEFVETDDASDVKLETTVYPPFSQNNSPNVTHVTGLQSALDAKLTRAGGTLTGDVTMSKENGRFIFYEQNYAANNNAGIEFKTNGGQHLELIHEITDGEINTTGGNGQALILRSDSGVPQAGLEVEGEIFAKSNQRVFHDAYHPNADKWTTARTLTLSGDASGSVSIDGSANKTLDVSIDSSIVWKNGLIDISDDAARSVYFILADYDSYGFVGKVVSNRRSGNTCSFNYDIHAVKPLTAGENGSYSVRGSTTQIDRAASIVKVTHNGIVKLALKIDNVPQYLKPQRFSYFNANTVDPIDAICVTDDKITAEETVTVSHQSYRQDWGFNNAKLSGATYFLDDVTAPTFNGALSGNASSASKWQTARTLTLSGDASGSVSIDGSANATLSVAVANDSHTHDGRYYTEAESDSRFMPKAGGQMDGALTIRHTNVQLNLMDSTYSDNYWQLDHQNGVMAFRYNGGTEDFKLNENGTAVFSHTVTAPTFSGALSGNASSATKLATSRSLTIGKATKSFDGTADLAWTAEELTGAASAGQQSFGSGELVTTDEFLSLLAAKGAFSTHYWVCRGSWSYAAQVKVDTGYGVIGTAGCVIEVIGTSTNGCTIRVTTPTTNSGGTSRREYTYVSNGSTYSPGWRSGYSTHYHPEADKWSTARTLTLSGDLSGSVSIDGSSNVTLSASVANDSHTHSKQSPMNADWNAQTAEFRTGTDSAPAGSGLSSFLNWIQWGHNGGSKYRHTLFSYADSSAMAQLWYGYKNNTSDTTSAATKQRIYMDNYHPLADVATRANGVVVSSSATTAWYDAVWHNNSNGLFSTPTVQIANSTGSIKSNRHYFAGTTYYLREATGAYGTVATYGRKGGWGGYSIEGRVNFMHNGTDRCGLYNDVSNQWILESTLGAGLKLFYGSSQKLETTSSGVTVSGALTASGSVNDSSGRVYSPGNPPPASTNQVYSGTTENNTDYPIGTVVVSRIGTSADKRLNNHVTISYSGGTDYTQLLNGNGTTPLNGTWSHRGYVGVFDGYQFGLYERVL